MRLATLPSASSSESSDGHTSCSKSSPEKPVKSLTAAVQKSYTLMKWTVTIGWAIYPIGYFLGYLAGGTDVGTLNIVYNLADVLNKIAFGLFIWYAANEDTSSSH